MTASQHGIAPPDAGRLHRQSHRVLSDRPGDGSTSGTGTAIDRVLELVGRRQLSATEVRVLLRLVDREAGVPELAEALGLRPVEITCAGRRLASRGLMRWYHVGKRKGSRMGTTRAGLATVRALLTAAG
jgi:hypothetical protein